MNFRPYRDNIFTKLPGTRIFLFIVFSKKFWGILAHVRHPTNGSGVVGKSHAAAFAFLSQSSPSDTRTRTFTVAFSSPGSSNSSGGSGNGDGINRVGNAECAKKKGAVGNKRSPTVFQVQKAIGLVDDRDDRLSTKGSSFMNLMASTPMGQPEGSVGRKVREMSEWVVRSTESQVLQGQKFVLVVCLMILPAWVFLLLVASGVLKLPFAIHYIDDLLA